jgi:hypothetical protein
VILKNIPEYNGSRLSWKINVGYCEASDLAPRSRFDGQIYDDACDTGFWVRSTGSGHRVLFSLESTVNTRDGEDVSHWEYVAIKAEGPNGYCTKRINLNHLRVVVFND